MTRTRLERIGAIMILIRGNKFRIYRKNARMFHGRIKYMNEKFHLILYKKTLLSVESFSLYNSGRLVQSTRKNETVE